MARKSPCTRPFWADWPDERLLGLRLRDLGLKEPGATVRRAIDRLEADLQSRGLKLRPHFWLSDDWFCPDGVPGIAVPFYLAHPRLAALEQRMVGTAEGAEGPECLRILRHEAGHAIENAFLLRRLPPRRDCFGPSSRRYPSAYSPRPFSRAYVRHLPGHYAQSHPDEDFAETFAVWLQDPPTRWRKRYAGWPALRKLETMEWLMEAVRGMAPLVRSTTRIGPLEESGRTLAQHYASKRKKWRLVPSAALESCLGRVLSELGQPNKPDASGYLRVTTAERFLRKIKADTAGSLAVRMGRRRYEVAWALESWARHAGKSGWVIPSTAPFRDGAPPPTFGRRSRKIPSA